MTIKVAHMFFETNMAYAHASLRQILEENKIKKLDRHEIACFINANFSACKMLTVDDVMLYYRGHGPGTVTPEVLRTLPTFYGGARLIFSRNLETALINQFEELFQVKNKTSKTLKVVGASD